MDGKEAASELWKRISAEKYRADEDASLLELSLKAQSHLIQQDQLFTRQLQRMLVTRLVAVAILCAIVQGVEQENGLDNWFVKVVRIGALLVVGKVSFTLHRHDLVKTLCNNMTGGYPAFGDEESDQCASKWYTPVHALAQLLQYRFLWNPTFYNGRRSVSKAPEAKCASTEVVLDKIFLLTALDVTVVYLVARGLLTS